jgi:hypothetical protein
MNPGKGIKPLRKRDYEDVGKGLGHGPWKSVYGGIVLRWQWDAPRGNHVTAQPHLWDIATLRHMLRGDG